MRIPEPRWRVQRAIVGIWLDCLVTAPRPGPTIVQGQMIAVLIIGEAVERTILSTGLWAFVSFRLRQSSTVVSGKGGKTRTRKSETFFNSLPVIINLTFFQNFVFLWTSRQSNISSTSMDPNTPFSLL